VINISQVIRCNHPVCAPTTYACPQLPKNISRGIECAGFHNRCLTVQLNAKKKKEKGNIKGDLEGRSCRPDFPQQICMYPTRVA
jgi:hypothetical protein